MLDFYFIEEEEDDYRDIVFYNGDPNLCSFCDGPIIYDYSEHVGLDQFKKRTYCSEFCQEKLKDTHNVKPKQPSRSAISIRPIIKVKKQHIRNHARRAYKESDKCKECYICGYNDHFEICHIKSISSFPKSTLVEVVNQLSNLIALCPTHHWELDNNRFSLIL